MYQKTGHIKNSEVEFSRREMLRVLAGAGAFLILPAVPAMSGNKGNATSGSLIRRTIPSTGETIPVIGLGTARTFDVDPSGPLEDLKKVIKVLYDSGGTVVDTSPMYGNAEEVIGKITTGLGLTGKLFFATKVWTRGREPGIRQMKKSMELLRTDRIDLMQVHNLVDTDVQLETMRKWKEEGRIRYTGVTHYRVDAYPQLIRILENEKLDFIQFNFSIGVREAEERLLPLAADRGVATIINEPFEKGSLFRKVRGKELPDWAAEFDCKSWAQYFLKYIVSHPAVTCAIPATSRPEHMQDNIKAAYGRLPDQKMRNRMVEYLEKI